MKMNEEVFGVRKKLLSMIMLQNYDYALETLHSLWLRKQADPAHKKLPYYAEKVAKSVKFVDGRILLQKYKKRYANK